MSDTPEFARVAHNALRALLEGKGVDQDRRREVHEELNGLLSKHAPIFADASLDFLNELFRSAAGRQRDMEAFKKRLDDMTPEQLLSVARADAEHAESLRVDRLKDLLSDAKPTLRAVLGLALSIAVQVLIARGNTSTGMIGDLNG